MQRRSRRRIRPQIQIRRQIRPLILILHPIQLTQFLILSASTKHDTPVTKFVCPSNTANCLPDDGSHTIIRTWVTLGFCLCADRAIDHTEILIDPHPNSDSLSPLINRIILRELIQQIKIFLLLLRQLIQQIKIFLLLLQQIPIIIKRKRRQRQ